MASISKYKTKGGIRWRAKAYIGEDKKTGRKLYKTRGGYVTRREAIAAGKQLDEDIAMGVLTVTEAKPKAPTFKQVYEEWLPHYRLTVRESTLANTLNCFRLHILPAIGELPVDRISDEDMQKAIELWYHETTFYKRYYRHARRVIKYARMRGYTDTVPGQDIIMPKAIDQPGTHAEFWDKDQLNAFFSTFNLDRDLKKYTFFRILAYSGLRNGEAFALTWEDINFAKQTINVNKTQSQGIGGRTLVNAPKTPASRRIVPIDEDTIKILKRWRSEQRLYLYSGYSLHASHQLLFTSGTNTRLRQKVSTNWLNKIIRDNSLTPQITVHKFRKSYVSNLLLAGVPVPVVQRLVGHSDPKITLMIYAQVHQEQEVDAAATLAKYLKS